MDELLKSFPLSFLLRSFFSGTFFVISYFVATGDLGPRILQITQENVLKIGIPFALIAGVAVYGLHRSLIYPFIEDLLNSPKARNARSQGERLISEVVIRRIITSWDDKSSDGNPRFERTRQLEVWADYIHLQFTSALCIGLGALIGVILNKNWCLCSLNLPPVNPPLLITMIVFFVAAMISNWRALSVEEYAKTEMPPQVTAPQENRITIFLK